MAQKNQKKALKVNAYFFVLDTIDNYNLRVNAGYLHPDLFLGCECVQNADELEDKLRDLLPEDRVFVYVHAFRTSKEWNVKLEAKMEEIKRKVSDSINIKIVTSDNPEEVKSKFPGADVDRYSDLMIKARQNNYQPQTIKEIYGDDSGEYYRSTVNKKNLVFISHSSLDKVIVSHFVDKLLKLGMNVKPEEIFYTSDYSSSLETGTNIPAGLKNALTNMTIFIQFVSESYKKSEVCLNEMGVAWFRLNPDKIITLLMPGATVKDIGFLNAQSVGINIQDKNTMFRIFDDFHETLKENRPKAGEFKTKLEEFHNELSKLITLS